MDTSVESFGMIFQKIYQFMANTEMSTLGVTFTLWQLFMFSMIAMGLASFIVKWRS